VRGKIGGNIMHKIPIEEEADLVKYCETYGEAYSTLMDAGYDNVEASFILKDFLEISEVERGLE